MKEASGDEPNEIDSITCWLKVERRWSNLGVAYIFYTNTWKIVCIVF